jgi:ABC-2 type transport system permease protein
MFPLVSVMVSTRHLAPQVVVLMIVAAFFGWRPSAAAFAYALMGFAILFLFLVGLGLIFSTLNVFFRDAEQVVEIVTMVAFWSAPVMYAWTFLADVIGEGPLLTLYLSNPLAVSVNLFHEAFWAPTVDSPLALPDMLVPGMLCGLIVVGSLVIGQLAFVRLQGRFAAEL